MDTTSLLALLGLVALGSYVQTVSGFAFGLIVMGGATYVGLASVAFTANVVTFVALANTATAVHRRQSYINFRIMLYASLGVLLFSGVGLYVLAHLSSNAVDVLEMLLGIVILGSGVLLMMHPKPLQSISSKGAHLIAGGLGGLLSGMFGAGGPPLVVHMYRQPLDFAVVRTTLLAILGIMPLIRVIFEIVSGNITLEIMKLVALAVPVSILTTLFAKRFPPPVSDLVMRRFAFGLLCVLGISLILRQL